MPKPPDHRFRRAVVAGALAVLILLALTAGHSNAGSARPGDPSPDFSEEPGSPPGAQAERFAVGTP
jgi:hypothetical protein